jgi:hypothetical protein
MAENIKKKLRTAYELKLQSEISAKLSFVIGHIFYTDVQNQISSFIIRN